MKSYYTLSGQARNISMAITVFPACVHVVKLFLRHWCRK